jgi:virginiamycin A acetyltransferase
MKKLVPRFVVDYCRWISYRFRYPALIVDQNVLIAGSCKFDRHTRLYVGSLLQNVEVGKCTYIGGNSRITNCQIGSFCSIAPDVVIGGGVHPVSEFVSTSPVFYSRGAQCGKTFTAQTLFQEYKNTQIGSDVWVGYRSVVLPGVSVGHGAVVGAGAVVTRDVPPYAVVAGAPARIIRFRFREDVVNRLLASSWWFREIDDLKANVDAFKSPDHSFFDPR